jgi:hypothetical protein
MSRDRAAFGFGLAAMLLGGVGLWSSFGHVDWGFVRTAAPVALIVIGAGMVLLSRQHN